MAKEIPKIIPVDINKRQAIGVKLPFNSPYVFESTFITKEQVKFNLINLLLTVPGEKILNPTFGVGLRSYLFEPNINEDILRDIIQQQVNNNIPYVTINDIKFQKDPSENTLFITIDYSLINSETDTLTFNFQ
jgi:phage baseplate assembly protein W